MEIFKVLCRTSLRSEMLLQLLLRASTSGPNLFSRHGAAAPMLKGSSERVIEFDPLSPTSYERNVMEAIETNYIGKLGTKLEPAGKIRVFAMVDA